MTKRQNPSHDEQAVRYRDFYANKDEDKERQDLRPHLPLVPTDARPDVIIESLARGLICEE